MWPIVFSMTKTAKFKFRKLPFHLTMLTEVRRTRPILACFHNHCCLNTVCAKVCRPTVLKLLIQPTYNSSVCWRDGLLWTRRQLYFRFSGIWVMWDNCGVVTGGSGKLASVPSLFFHTAHNGTLRHSTYWENVANLQHGWNGCHTISNSQVD